MRDCKGVPAFLPVCWALDEVCHSLGLDGGGDGSGDASAALRCMQSTLVLQKFEECALWFRREVTAISQKLAQPVPYAYFHLVRLQLVINLLLIAYAIVPLGVWPLTVAIQFLVSLILIGLLDVAVALADPFGDDDVDFDLEAPLRAATANVTSILSSPRAATGRRLPAQLRNPLRSDFPGSLGPMSPLQVRIRTRARRSKPAITPNPSGAQVEGGDDRGAGAGASRGEGGLSSSSSSHARLLSGSSTRSDGGGGHASGGGGMDAVADDGGLFASGTVRERL